MFKVFMSLDGKARKLIIIWVVALTVILMSSFFISFRELVGIEYAGVEFPFWAKISIYFLLVAGPVLPTLFEQR